MLDKMFKYDILYTADRDHEDPFHNKPINTKPTEIMKPAKTLADYQQEVQRLNQELGTERTKRETAEANAAEANAKLTTAEAAATEADRARVAAEARSSSSSAPAPDPAPNTCQRQDPPEKKKRSWLWPALAGCAALFLLFLGILALGGVGYWLYNSNKDSVASTGRTPAQEKAAALAGGVEEAPASEPENGAHPGREFVKTQNGFGLLCFKGNRQICWFNQHDDIAPNTPPGTKVLKVSPAEVQRHGVGPTTPKAREQWAELGDESWTYVAVPTATVSRWRAQ